jgi:hypothetical protein
MTEERRVDKILIGLYILMAAIPSKKAVEQTSIL